MSNKADVKVVIDTRGDDIDILNRIADMIPVEDEAVLSYLSYIKLCFMEKLTEEGETFPKEDYPIGHKLGLSEEEFDKLIENEFKNE